MSSDEQENSANGALIVPPQDKPDHDITPRVPIHAVQLTRDGKREADTRQTLRNRTPRSLMVLLRTPASDTRSCNPQGDCGRLQTPSLRYVEGSPCKQDRCAGVLCTLAQHKFIIGGDYMTIVGTQGYYRIIPSEPSPTHF